MDKKEEKDSCGKPMYSCLHMMVQNVFDMQALALKGE
jgi:hypothetical protein